MEVTVQIAVETSQVGVLISRIAARLGCHPINQNLGKGANSNRPLTFTACGYLY